MYNFFLHSIKLSGYRMWINFDKNPLSEEQNNYAGKIEDVFIVYDLDAWPINPTNNFKFKNSSLGATSIVKARKLWV